MTYAGLCLAMLTTSIGGMTVRAADEPLVPRLRVAFASNRHHYWYPRIVLYEHDGHDQGRIVRTLPSAEKRLDHQPTLSGDGRFCAYGWEAEGGVGRLQLWDLQRDSAIDVTAIQSPNTLFSPSLSADGKLLAFTGWGLPGVSNRWDVQLYDVERQAPLELPGLNSPDSDERRVALSGDGTCLAFTSNAADGAGLSDLRLYNRDTRQVDLLVELNSSASENYPSLSHDGRWLCFVSDRAGNMDVMLFDRQTRKLVELPGINSPGQEQSPAITADGRYVVFVSERFEGPGEHDLFLYDRHAARLLPTPDLNTATDEYDPAIVLLPE